jgi:hypothetical protein
MQADDRGERSDIPTTKPRTSQKHPNPPWREEHKAAKKALRQIRLGMEHAMGGMQR